MQKDFDGWNKEKKRLNFVGVSAMPFPKKQWVWVCSLGVNIGFEQNGTSNEFERPVVVVKKFNNQMYWVVPLSSKQKSFDFYYNFTDPLGNPVALISSQLRLVSIHRFKREMYRLSDADFENLLSQLRGFLDKSKPRTGRGFSGPSESEGALYKQ
ncbi:MAG: type II toxin-antitoxin system PemK/MazF family toxin [Candidatus Kaiserbacteria bacterium]|nr:type II toxin-antitoxin system PemK/MazF family toxin [Candidatus Kaiserbacteria bacterium]